MTEDLMYEAVKRLNSDSIRFKDDPRTLYQINIALVAIIERGQSIPVGKWWDVIDYALEYRSDLDDGRPVL